MIPHLEGLARVFAASDRLFIRALEGADRDALLRRPGGAGNPMLWIAGHATRVRSQVGQLGMLRANAGLSRLVG